VQAAVKSVKDDLKGQANELAKAHKSLVGLALFTIFGLDVVMCGGDLRSVFSFSSARVST
jgi:hypothetical protein